MVDKAVMRWMVLKDFRLHISLVSVYKYLDMHSACLQELTKLLQKIKSHRATCSYCDMDSFIHLQEGIQILLNDLNSENMCPKDLRQHSCDEHCSLNCHCRVVYNWKISLCLFGGLLLFTANSSVTANSIKKLCEQKACQLPASDIKEQKAVLISIFTSYDSPSSDYNEQKDLMLKAEKKPGQSGSSIHHSSFLEITKDVVRFLSNDLAMILFHRTLSMLSRCVLKKSNDVINVSIIGTLNNGRPLLCLNAPNSAKKCSARESTALNNNNGRVREQKIQDQVKIFFMNNTGIINHEKEDINGENKTEKKIQMDVENVKSIKDGTHDEINDKDGKDQSENQGLIKVIPEIFRFVEVRTGTDIVVCPATQQLVLEPFLNRFSAPDNKPSKHDTMAMEFLRLCSMHDYPSKQGPSLLRLAEAGFYYEGNGDELICFSCGVRNRNWSYGDSPREIHQRLSPGCKFLTEGGDGNVQVPRDQPTEGRPS